MSETNSYDGQNRLAELLRAVAYREQIAEALGIQDLDSQDEEFWTGQRRAARLRFFALCLQRLGWDLALDQAALDAEQANTVADEAESLLADGTLRYAAVRQWWRNRGQFEYSQAIERRRERDRLNNTVLRVLLILEEGGAKYLAYSSDFTAVHLVNTPEEAYQFPVKSVAELERAYLQEMAKHFDAVKDTFKARQVKVLSAARQTP